MAKTQKKQQSNGISDFIKELWFLSIRFEKRRRELKELVREPESPYYTDDTQEAKAIVQDPDEYHSVGAFMVPEIATWDYIMAHAQDDDIKVKIDDALEALERAYPEQLRIGSVYEYFYCVVVATDGEATWRRQPASSRCVR